MKGILLPFELVGIDGKEYTNACSNNKEESVIEWKYLRNCETNPLPRQFKI